MELIYWWIFNITSIYSTYEIIHPKIRLLRNWTAHGPDSLVKLCFTHHAAILRALSWLDLATQGPMALLMHSFIEKRPKTQYSDPSIYFATPHPSTFEPGKYLGVIEDLATRSICITLLDTRLIPKYGWASTFHASFQVHGPAYSRCLSWCSIAHNTWKNPCHVVP